MRLHLDAGAADPSNSCLKPNKTVEPGQLQPNFRAESPVPTRTNILWPRIQSNKPLQIFYENFLGIAEIERA